MRLSAPRRPMSFKITPDPSRATSLTSQPAPGAFWLFSYPTPPTFIATAQGSRAQCITAISSFCSTNSSHSRPRLPGAVNYNYIKLLERYVAIFLTISLSSSTNSSHSRLRLPGAVDYTYIKLLAPGRGVLHLYKASGPAQGSRALCCISLIVYRLPNIIRALVHIVRFADFNFHPALGPLALEQICPACALEVALLIREEVVDLVLKGSGANGRHLLKPESKLQDKCCERTAALDVENTMCRVNGIGSNAGAWDAADHGGTLSDILRYRFDAPQERIEAAGSRGGLISHLPAAARGRERGGIPTGRVSARPGTAEGVTPAAAVLAQTHAVLMPVPAEAIWHVARAPAVEKLVDEHLADFYLMDSAGYFFSSIHRIAAPTYVPSEEDVLRAHAKSTAIIETRFWMGDLMRTCHLLLFSSCEGNVYETSASVGDVAPSPIHIHLVNVADLAPQNRMREPLYLFESVINSRWFLRTSVILFLNKIDVFKRKHCLLAFVVPEGDNVNIAGARRR
ncbi:hypothetical protein DFH08DRAFT_997941 [Mycena albidolilacea]|uniref:Uncharacterized protein n=1 Tax=Mycena albidolilacea TaxID=1033008 RepID=A0AAD6YWI5_9AGAR|nr:hypothetical protein DFH08DRAFT_997941 [Mycena albidolilacea]